MGRIYKCALLLIGVARGGAAWSVVFHSASFRVYYIADCTAEESAMVGDRLDNDIIPAKSIGMKTVWIMKGLAKYQDNRLGKDVADYQINTLSELINIL